MLRADSFDRHAYSGSYINCVVIFCTIVAVDELYFSDKLGLHHPYCAMLFQHGHEHGWSEVN